MCEYVRAPVLLQIDRERRREMDLTQIRVDYTHPPCLQSALHNLKSSYASLSHFGNGGGGWGLGGAACALKHLKR